MSLDLAAAVVGLMAFFGRLIHKLHLIVKASSAALKVLLELSDFHTHIQFLATSNRLKLVSLHRASS
jgi:hypothetical protein